MNIITYRNLTLVRAPYAVLPDKSRGRLHPINEETDRTPVQRDRDRIIHSASFRRLKGKTQVFIDGKGDYYRTRLTHSLEVSQIARNMARVLQLDEDLAELCGLAHDIGHPPFGHAGESALDECMQPVGGFDHNEQALRALMVIEYPYAEHIGLNLCWESIEGLIKHNGPLKANKRGATILDFDKKLQLQLDSYPSLEAQLAAAADDIAYNGHDVDDAHKAGLLSYDRIRELPFYAEALKDLERTMDAEDRRRQISYAVRRTIGLWMRDVQDNTRANLAALKPESADDIRNAGKAVGFFSDAVWEQIKELKKVMYNDVYRHPDVMQFCNHSALALKELFAAMVERPERLPTEYRNTAEPLERNIGDFIAGMTDRYALKHHAKWCD